MHKICLAVIAVSAFAATSAEACSVSRFRFQFGQDTTSVMQTTNRESCRITVFAGSTSRFDSNRITEPAKNGTVTPQGAAGVIYRARAGFTGADSFAFTITGNGASLEGPSTVRVSVTVN